mmetsp:Transcript_22740/g.56337  ORF Transcript_22740/g.56337 Transcript_22740/m.56337 type:complete len:241 (-) Transcript_22740:933-1655(-)
MDSQKGLSLLLFALGDIPHRHQDAIDIDQPSNDQIDLLPHRFQSLHRITNVLLNLFQVPIRNFLPCPVVHSHVCVFLLQGPEVVSNCIRNGLVFLKGDFRLFLLLLLFPFSSGFFCYYFWFNFVATSNCRSLFLRICCIFTRSRSLLGFWALRFWTLRIRLTSTTIIVVVIIIIIFVPIAHCNILIPVIVIVIILLLDFHIGGFHLDDGSLEKAIGLPHKRRCDLVRTVQSSQGFRQTNH